MGPRLGNHIPPCFFVYFFVRVGVCSGVARCGPSRARPNLLATYHAYLIPFHKVLYNRSIELEPCSLRRITVPGSPANLTKQGLLAARSMKLLITEKWRRSFFSFLRFPQNDWRYAPINADFSSMQSMCLGNFSILATPLGVWQAIPKSFLFFEENFSSSYTVCKWRASPLSPTQGWLSWVSRVGHGPPINHSVVILHTAFPVTVCCNCASGVLGQNSVCAEWEVSYSIY